MVKDGSKRCDKKENFPIELPRAFISTSARQIRSGPGMVQPLLRPIKYSWGSRNSLEVVGYIPI